MYLDRTNESSQESDTTSMPEFCPASNSSIDFGNSDDIENKAENKASK